MNIQPEDIESIELALLTEAIYRRYGYDFSNYAETSFKRRVKNQLDSCQETHISSLIAHIIHDSDFFHQFLVDMSVTVTEMFRDPEVYSAYREHVIPLLKTYPFIKIWHAGCATGEEAYSMAIFLAEEGLLERTHIYATDINPQSLKIAREGIYPSDTITQYKDNYLSAGGQGQLADYFYAKFDSVKIDEHIRQKITFAHHNLVCDQVFGEMNWVVCRNVLIYFNKSLQDKVFTLLKNSLCSFGFLSLGTKETLELSAVGHEFEAVCTKAKLYRRLMEGSPQQ